MAAPLTLTVWSRSPAGKKCVAGERTWARPSYEEFAEALEGLVREVAAPNVAAFATCDVGGPELGMGAIAALDDGGELAGTSRYLWQHTAPLAGLAL